MRVMNTANQAQKSKNPRDLIAPVIEAMKDYRMPTHKEVGIDYDDTGAIIAIIIYYIGRERSIGITKLEGYLILLDRLVMEQTKQHLFYWSLTKGGHIRNFKKVIDFMIEQQLISRKGISQFNLLRNVSNITGFDRMFDGIFHWMSMILDKYFRVTASELSVQVLGSVGSGRPKASSRQHALMSQMNDKLDDHKEEYERLHNGDVEEGEGHEEN